MAVQRLRGVAGLNRLADVRRERVRRQLSAERSRRVERARRDPRFFLAYYLPHLFESPLGPHHQQIIDDFVSMLDRTEGVDAGNVPVADVDAAHAAVKAAVAADDDPDEGRDLTEAEWEALLQQEAVDQVANCAAYACPREHGKSTLIVGLVVWALCYRLRRYVIFVADTVHPQAEDRLGEVKAELETNDRIRDDFGDLHGARWTGRDIITSSGIRVRAYGTGSKLRGAKFRQARPDLAILDDCENDEQCRTELQRGKVRDWLTKVLLNAIDSDRGVVVVLGTVIHHDSMLARLVGKEYFKGWLKRRYKALMGAANGVLHALWPSRWPVDKLLRKRSADTGIGSRAFASEFQNDPVTDETSPVRLAWLEAARDRGRGQAFATSYADVVSMLGAHPLCMVQCWDLGWVDTKEKAEETDSNFSVCTTWAVRADNRHRVAVRLWRDRGLTPGQMLGQMRAEAAMLRPPEDSPCADWFRVGIESVGLQKQLYAVGLQQSSDLPVVPIFTGANKHDPFEGIPRLGNLYEAGLVTLPWPGEDTADHRTQRRLVQTYMNELYGLGKEAHDDTVLSQWFCDMLVVRLLAALDKHGVKIKERTDERKRSSWAVQRQ